MHASLSLSLGFCLILSPLLLLFTDKQLSLCLRLSSLSLHEALSARAQDQSAFGPANARPRHPRRRRRRSSYKPHVQRPEPISLTHDLLLDRAIMETLPMLPILILASLAYINQPAACAAASKRSSIYPSHINPLFRNYNYLSRDGKSPRLIHIKPKFTNLFCLTVTTECPPSASGDRRYFCPSARPTLIGGSKLIKRYLRGSSKSKTSGQTCIRPDQFCDGVDNCAGGEDENEQMCFLYRPVRGDRSHSVRAGKMFMGLFTRFAAHVSAGRRLQEVGQPGLGHEDTDHWQAPPGGIASAAAAVTEGPIKTSSSERRRRCPRRPLLL